MDALGIAAFEQSFLYIFPLNFSNKSSSSGTVFFNLAPKAFQTFVATSSSD